MRTFALASLLLAPAAALAQSPDSPAPAGAAASELVVLDAFPVVENPIVAATAVDSLGSKVTTISAAQLAALNATDLQSALRETPGVIVTHHNVVGSFGGGEGGAVFIRGMGTARPGAEIQLSIDGIPSYNSVWTHPILDMLSVDLARDIAVYKGAQPVLYGNMAFAVVDLDPKAQEQPGTSGRLALTAGSFGTWSALAEGGTRTDTFDAYALASTRQSDGARADSDGRLRSYYTRLGWTFSPHWNAHVIYNRTDNYAQDPGPDAALVPASLLYANGRFADENDLLVATLANKYELAEGYVKPYYSSGTLNWTGQRNSTTKLNTDDTITDYANYGVKTRETVRPWTGAELLGGFDLDFITGKYRTVTNGVAAAFPQKFARLVQPYASFAQLWELGSGWSVKPSVGARWFDHNLFADEFAPQAGLVVEGAGFEFHTSAARGVNYPGFYVMAYPPGNNLHRELEAEKVDHFEAGVSRRFGSLVKAELTYFRDRGTDRIITSFPPYPAVWKNLARYRTEGVEAAVTVTPTRDLSFFGGVTTMNTTPDDLPYAPEWSASAGVNWRFAKNFRLSVDGQYVGSRYVTSRARTITALNTVELDSYVLLNARLAYEFSLPAWKLAGECFVAGENLGDADYEQRYGYPMPGINGTFGVSLKF